MKIGAVSAELCEQVKRNKKSAVPGSPQVPQWCSIRVAPATVKDAAADLSAAGAERVALRLRLQNVRPREEGRSSV